MYGKHVGTGVKQEFYKQSAGPSWFYGLLLLFKCLKLKLTKPQRVRQLLSASAPPLISAHFPKFIPLPLQPAEHPPRSRWLSQYTVHRWRVKRQGGESAPIKVAIVSSFLFALRLVWREATRDHKARYNRNLLQIVPRPFLTSINGFNTLFIVFKWDFFPLLKLHIHV